jgi:peptidoglycan hydrolase CwlO-like protein
MIEMEDKKLENFSNKIIQGVGSISSLIIHTILFVVFFVLFLFGIEIDKILLILTTIVSLEAIYLSIFIQMSVNIQTKKLISVASDVEDIQKDVEEIQENVEEIQENVEEIQENVEEIQENTEDDEDESIEKQNI